MAPGKTSASPGSGEFQVKTDQANKKEAMPEKRRGGRGEREKMLLRAFQSNPCCRRTSFDSVASPRVVVESPRKGETTRARTLCSPQHPDSTWDTLGWFWLPTRRC